MREKALEEIRNASDLQALQELRVRYLGKKGEITQRLKSLAQLPPDERREAGKEISQLKTEIDTAIGERREAIEQAQLQARLARETLDVTLPGVGEPTGGLHVLKKVRHKL